MIIILFEVHATTVDNENHICSGFYDVGLSQLGLRQAKELGARYAQDHFDAIFCSDLQRSYKTAELAFNDRFPIIKDARLRECDYGDLTRHPASEVDPEKLNRIIRPFPNGESYEQTTNRIGQFLTDLLRDYDGKNVMIIGHGATRGGLEHWLKGLTIKESIIASKDWQPGLHYELNKMPELK